MLGRPEKFNKAQTKEIGRLSKLYGGLGAHEILNADLRSKKSKLRNLELFPSGTEVSKPTVYKYGHAAGTSYKLGRRRSVAA
jgi:hypothetical protein